MTTSKNFSQIKPFTIALFTFLCSGTGEGKEVLLLSTDEAIRLAFLNNRDLQVTEPQRGGGGKPFTSFRQTGEPRGGNIGKRGFLWKRRERGKF